MQSARNPETPNEFCAGLNNSETPPPEANERRRADTRKKLVGLGAIEALERALLAE